MKKLITTLAAGAAAIALMGPASAKIPAPEPDDDPGAVHSYILLDRTGSMSSIWDEALTSVNAYAASVGEADEGEIEGSDIKTDVTLAIFDFQESMQFDVLREKVGAEDWTDVTNEEANPRGMTPLFDAIGRMVSLAEADDPEKAAWRTHLVSLPAMVPKLRSTGPRQKAGKLSSSAQNLPALTMPKPSVFPPRKQWRWARAQCETPCRRWPRNPAPMARARKQKSSSMTKIAQLLTRKALNNARDSKGDDREPGSLSVLVARFH